MAQTIIPVDASQLGRVSLAAMDAGEYIRAQVESGAFEFFRIGQCYFVTTAEDTGAGRELVIVCAEGKNLASAALELQTIAKRAGYKTVRIHAFRKGMRRLLHRIKFKEAETVYRLTL